jgi:hypothetical protein
MHRPGDPRQAAISDDLSKVVRCLVILKFDNSTLAVRAKQHKYSAIEAKNQMTEFRLETLSIGRSNDPWNILEASAEKNVALLRSWTSVSCLYSATIFNNPISQQKNVLFD